MSENCQQCWYAYKGFAAHCGNCDCCKPKDPPSQEAAHSSCAVRLRLWQRATPGRVGATPARLTPRGRPPRRTAAPLR